jgi:hypothetical protein
VRHDGRVRVGIADHFGWAIAVAATADHGMIVAAE